MLLNIITAALVGVSALVTVAAVPAPLLVPQSLHRRQLDSRSPKDNRDNNDIKIIDTTEVALSESSRNSEVQLLVAIKQTEIIRNGCQNEKRNLQDRIRSNHFRNKNKDVNTVIIIITNIIDIRVSDNKKNRYMRRVINNRGRKNNNKNNNKDITVQITEVEAITIDFNSKDDKHKSGNKKDKNGKNDKSGKSNKSEKHDKKPADAIASATAAALASIQTVDPNAPYMQTNSSVLLPDGSPPPSNSNVDLDPARILEDGNDDAIVGSA